MKDRTEIIVDDEIILKELSLDETEPIFNLLTSQREYFSEWLPFVEHTKQIEDTRGFVEAVVNSCYPNLTCAIYYKNEFVGLCGLRDTDLSNHKTEIGYWLSRDHQKKGIVTRSCGALINYVFNEMKMNKILIRAVVDNKKSWRIAEKLGFTKEGIERAGELHSDGYKDLVVYGLLRSEWTK